MASCDQGIVEIRDQLRDITECGVCTETYKDPKILSCIHTFCKKCLEDTASESGRKSGETMPCPLCRKEFTIPLQGFSGIPNNFFMMKLIEMSRVLIPSFSRFECYICLEENENPASAVEIPSADMFCRDCSMKLCESCCRHHRKSRLTKNHELIKVDSDSLTREVAGCLIPEFCEKHEREKLKIYCSGCDKVVCAFCFIECHQNHKWSEVDMMAEEFRSQIEAGIENLRSGNANLLKKKKELDQRKDDINRSVTTLEVTIMERKKFLVEMIEKHSNLLLTQLQVKRKEKQKELKIEEEEVGRQLAYQESFTTYCQNMITRGSAVVICQTHCELKARIAELQEMSPSVCQRPIKPLKLSGLMSQVDRYLKDNGKNFIGVLMDDAKCAIIRNRHFLSFPSLKPSQTDHGTVRIAYTTSKRITGIAIIGEEFFMTTEQNSLIEVYDLLKFHIKRTLKINDLNCPEDMISSSLLKCLYIFDATGYGVIYQMTINGVRLSKWITGHKFVRLSITSDLTTVIVTFVGRDKVKEYLSIDQKSLANKRLMREVELSDCKFAVKLANGHYLVSAKDRVFEVDESGKAITRRCPEKMKDPRHIVLKEDGSVIVIDRDNRRVLKLNSDLVLQTEILPPQDGLGLMNPEAMALDELSRQLFIVDHDNTRKTWRVLIAEDI